ncbi:hypothetical protein LDENG_00208470, partial [Lucifuga dentata]
MVGLFDDDDVMKAQKRHSAPHSTVERISQAILPPAAHQLLFSQSDEFSVAHIIVRALFGLVSGAALFLGIAHNLPLTFDLKLIGGCVFVAVCILAGTFSSFFRCSVLLVFPSMLGSRGRRYLMLFILTVLYTGPVANIQRNTQAAALSVSCNLDLQLQRSRSLWRHTLNPFMVITRELMDGKAEFQQEAQNISREFQDMRDKVLFQYGDKHGEQKTVRESTQERFSRKTRMQCDVVVNKGIERCANWFDLRWEECMQKVKVPVINHILCVPMTFSFLCEIMRVMTPWCRDEIPVEGNFGQLFDKLNLSVDLLSREFSTELLIQEEEQESVLGGAVEITEPVKRSFLRLTTGMERVLDVLQLLLSFTFITFFTAAFGYVRHYRRDICFDNVYVTTYFRQIDARRRKAGKRCLLPLNKSERKKIVNPCSPKIHHDEFKPVMAGVFQFLSVSLLTVVLLSVDLTVFHVLDIVSRHTFTQFNISSSHQVDIKVGGATMMSRLLRKMVKAFNSSSSLDIQSDNLKCVARPSSLSVGVYVSCVCVMLLLLLFSCVQVYTNRLRRVIAAFYHPK